MAYHSRVHAILDGHWTRYREVGRGIGRASDGSDQFGACRVGVDAKSEGFVGHIVVLAVTVHLGEVRASSCFNFRVIA